MSCGQFNRLKKEDYEWMPYQGGETLVFRSNTGDVDTIFLLKKDTLTAYPEAQTVNGIEYEVLSVFCKHSDSNTPNNTHRYLENTFLEIKKAKDDRAEIVIDLSAKDAEFYRLSPIKIDSLSREKQIALQTAFGQYTDVYVINSEDYLGNFHQRSNFITKVYWSKSQGLIRFDKIDSTFWELEKKY
jgi:hypothetical protein